MKRHHREKLVIQAQVELEQFLLDLGKRHSLTEGEFIRVLTEIAHREVATHIKYLIRHERHPGDPDMPGGLEKGETA